MDPSATGADSPAAPAAAVGCDLQDLDEVRDAVARFGRRYLDRCFTAGEQDRYLRGGVGSLAARFAAKEAVLKLLGRPDGVDPRSVEVVTDPRGRPGVRLHGDLGAAALRCGLGRIDLSLSHTRRTAMAVATAVTTAGAAHGPSPASPTTPTQESPVATTDPTRTDAESRAELESEVRAVLAEHGRLARDAASLDRDDDLYAAGLTSHASVTVMLGLEDAFDVEFPQHLLRKSTFASVAAVVAALDEIGAGGEPA